MGDIGVQNNSTIMMVARLKGGSSKTLELKIKLVNEEELKLEVDEVITVLKLKELIFRRNSLLQKGNMCLTYAGVVLKDEKATLKDLNIKSGSTVS